MFFSTIDFVWKKQVYYQRFNTIFHENHICTEVIFFRKTAVS